MAEYIELVDGVTAAPDVIIIAATAVAGAGTANKPGETRAGCCTLPLMLQDRVKELGNEWKDSRPITHRLVFRVAPGVLASVLFYADLAFDILLALQLFSTGNEVWGKLTITFIGLQYLVSWIGVLLWLRAQFGMGCVWDTEKHDYSCVTTLFLLLGFPLGPLLLDLLMFLEPLTLLEWLPNPQTEYDGMEYKQLPGLGQLRLLLPAYRATRTLVEVTLEGLPQSVLQAYIFKRVVIDGAATGVDISPRLLVQSLTLSLLNLAKVWLDVVGSAAAADISVPEHLRSQLRMGVGLPLDALKKNAIEKWTSGQDQLADELMVKQLAAALRFNQSVVELNFAQAGLNDDRVKVLFAGLEKGALASCQELNLFNNEIGDIGLSALAKACASGALPQLENVYLAGNSGNEELVKGALRERKGSK